VGGAVIGADVVFNFFKKRIRKVKKKNSAKKAKDTAEKVKDAVEEAKDGFDWDNPEIELEPKNILTCFRSNPENNELNDLFAKKKFISFKHMDHEDLESMAKAAAEVENDIIILDLDTEDELREFLGFREEHEEDFDDTSFGLVISSRFYQDVKDELKDLKKDNKIESFACSKDGKEVKMVNLLLPLYKPQFDIESGADVVGLVADALGIPYVSTVMDVLGTGHEIKEAIQDGDVSAVDKVSIIGDIADILGIDAIANFSDIVSAASSVKKVTTSEGVNIGEDENSPCNEESKQL